MSRKDYQLLVYVAAGTSAVETTIGSSGLRVPPSVGGQAVDLVTMQVEPRPWQIEVADIGDAWASVMADSAGRLVHTGRVAELQARSDGGAWSAVAVGRISDEVDHVDRVTVTIQDERYVERRATAFATAGTVIGNGSTSHYSGTILYPAGLEAAYGGFLPTTPKTVDAFVGSTAGTLVYLAVYSSMIVGGRWNQSIRQFIVNDVDPTKQVSTSSTSGCFRTLRANVDGTDYEIATFDSVILPLGTGTIADRFTPGRTIVDRIRYTPGDLNLALWIATSGGAFSTSASPGDHQVYLHAPAAPPSRVAPLHIGGAAGIEPFRLLRDLYDAAGVRYSSSGMQDLIDDTVFGLSWWRITEPQPLAEWVDEYLYKPYGVIPLTRADGLLYPTKTHLPQDVQSTALFAFTASNASPPHPEWQHSGRDVITVVRARFLEELLIPSSERTTQGDWAADGIGTEERWLEKTHDRLDDGSLPRVEQILYYDGLHANGDLIIRNGRIIHTQSVDTLVAVAARERFDRFGDGPIKGTISGLSAAASVTEGDFVTITIPTFLTPNTQSRGGTRVVQIISRPVTPAGPDFEWVDAGPNLQPLTTPTLSIAQATSSPKHAILVTLTNASSGQRYQLQHAVGSTAPGTTAWREWLAELAGTTTPFAVQPFPSNSTIAMRVRAAAPGRIRSAWSAVASAETAALTAPSSLASSGITATTVTLDWQVGETDYPVELLGTSGTCPSTAKDTIRRFTPGTQSYLLEGLAQDTTHCLAVRQYDQYGGVSAEATLEVQTSTTKPSCPAMAGIRIATGTSGT